MASGPTSAKENNMKFHPINVPTATDLFFVNQLKTAILTGKFNLGDKLPSERVLQEQLQVSRTVINSGLKKLAALHFIEIRPRYGAFVADYRVDGDLQTMNEIINFYGGHYRISLLNSIFEIRKLIENDVVRLDCIEQDEQCLQSAISNMQNLAKATNSKDAAQEIFAYVHSLALASKNYVYPLLINNFKSIYLTLGEWICNEVDVNSISEENLKLIKLIKSGDKNIAIAYHNKLINWSYEILTKQ